MRCCAYPRRLATCLAFHACGGQRVLFAPVTPGSDLINDGWVCSPRRGICTRACARAAISVQGCLLGGLLRRAVEPSTLAAHLSVSPIRGGLRGGVGGWGDRGVHRVCLKNGAGTRDSVSAGTRPGAGSLGSGRSGTLPFSLAHASPCSFTGAL